MERTMRRALLTLVLSSLAVGAVAGCGTDLAADDTDDGREKQDDGPIPDEAQLVHASDQCAQRGPGATGTCSFSWATGEELKLRAKLLSGSDEPVADRAIQFKMREGVGSLGQSRPVTDSGGTATASFEPPRQPGRATLLATVNDFEGVDAQDVDDLPDTIKWVLRFRPKGGGRLRVHVAYEGVYNQSDAIADVGRAKVSLFEASKTSCEDLYAAYGGRRAPNFDASTLPTSVTSKEKSLNTRDAATVSFNNAVDVGTSYTAWVQAYRETDGDAPAVELARGCESGSPKLQLGTDVDFPESEGGSEVRAAERGISVLDHAPVLAESYTITHRFDLTDALPDTVERWVDLIGLLVKSPGAFLVGCEKGDTKTRPDGSTVELCPDGGVPGLLKMLASSSVAKDLLPDDVVDALEDILDQGLARQAARDVIDSIVLDQLANVPGAEDARTITDDIISSLQNFGVKGPMRFDTRPQPRYVDGTPVVTYPEQKTTQSWTDFAFYWRRGDNCQQAQNFSQCRTEWIDTDEFSSGKDAVIEANFAAETEGVRQLHIRRHELTISFGDLVIGLLEHVVFPRYFSAKSNSGVVVKNVDTDMNDVVTFDELLGGVLVRCDDLSDGVGNDDGRVNGTLESAINRVCKSLRKDLVSRLKTIIRRELQLEETNVTLATPGASSTGGSATAPESCTLHQPSNYSEGWTYEPLPYVKRFGTRTDRCSWNVTFSDRQQGSGVFDDVSGTFSGPVQKN